MAYNTATFPKNGAYTVFGIPYSRNAIRDTKSRRFFTTLLNYKLMLRKVRRTESMRNVSYKVKP